MGTLLVECVDYLEADVQALRSAFESTAEHVEQLASTFDVDVEVASFGAAGEDVNAEASPEPISQEQPTAVR